MTLTPTPSIHYCWSMYRRNDSSPSTTPLSSSSSFLVVVVVVVFHIIIISVSVSLSSIVVSPSLSPSRSPTYFFLMQAAAASFCCGTTTTTTTTTTKRKAARGVIRLGGGLGGRIGGRPSSTSSFHLESAAPASVVAIQSFSQLAHLVSTSRSTSRTFHHHLHPQRVGRRRKQQQEISTATAATTTTTLLTRYLSTYSNGNGKAKTAGNNMNQGMDTEDTNHNKTTDVDDNIDDEILVDTTDDDDDDDDDNQNIHHHHHHPAPPLRILHLKRCVDSTQDETKRLLQKFYSGRDNIDNSAKSKERKKYFPISLAVIADDQSHGRGTSGRSWVSSSSSDGSSSSSSSGVDGKGNNLFLTYALPMNLIPMSQVTLLPLAVGLVVAETISMYLPSETSSSSSSSPNVLNLKWPNDVLLNKCKIAGTLIENARIEVVVDDDDNNSNKSPQPPPSSHDYWLVGIGVNIASHPTDLQNETTTTDVAAPRRATSLNEYYCTNNSHTSSPPLPTAAEFGTQLALKIQELVRSEWSTSRSNTRSTTTTTTTNSQNTIVDRWRRWAQMGTMQTIRDTGEVVKTVAIMDDGRLHVIDQQGKDKYLISDYFI